LFDDKASHPKAKDNYLKLCFSIFCMLRAYSGLKAIYNDSSVQIS